MYLDEKGKANTDFHKTEDWQSVFLVRFLGCLHQNSGNYQCIVLIQPAIDLAQKVLPITERKHEFT